MQLIVKSVCIIREVFWALYVYVILGLLHEIVKLYDGSAITKSKKSPFISTKLLGFWHLLTSFSLSLVPEIYGT